MEIRSNDEADRFSDSHFLIRFAINVRIIHSYSPSFLSLYLTPTFFITPTPLSLLLHPSMI